MAYALFLYVSEFLVYFLLENTLIMSSDIHRVFYAVNSFTVLSGLLCYSSSFILNTEVITLNRVAGACNPPQFLLASFAAETPASAGSDVVVVVSRCEVAILSSLWSSLMAVSVAEIPLTSVPSSSLIC